MSAIGTPRPLPVSFTRQGRTHRLVKRSAIAAIYDKIEAGQVAGFEVVEVVIEEPGPGPCDTELPLREWFGSFVPCETEAEAETWFRAIGGDQ